ncbi:energy transducer TonB [Bacteroides sp. 214]|uniref:energy transducer TonB n=1 Tax=Bacteroides sp. 214 TaxID=2302935 RepID=UPI0013D55A58|nr:energy transducer TonB [Bacteroides sp. 214]NDW13408.1 energy transducer TonB [Bacteroides sp. 214]
MEVKKSPKADLEGKRFTWLLLGYVMVLAFMFVAFEWSERDKVIDTSQALTEHVFEEEIVPITVQEVQPPPPPPEVPQAAETLNIVEDDVEVESNVQIQSEDTGEKVEVKYVAPVVVEEEVNEDEIFEVVEQSPEFPGGMSALMSFLSKNIKYPSIAAENGTQGTVTIQFVVNRDGSVVDPVVLRGVDPYLDKEAMRVIKTMPKWKPGMQRGKAVRVKYTVPVRFRLQ